MYISGYFSGWSSMRGRILFLFLLLIFVKGNSQISGFHVNYFGREDGIISTYVNDVAQDSVGFIWVGTREGLYRYDGYRFTGYFSKRADSTTITGNIINCLFTDSYGRLWVAGTQGVAVYKMTSDNFYRIADFNNTAGLASLGINTICEDKKGNILAGTSNAVYRYVENQRRFELVTLIENAQINDILVDDNNRIWIALNNNLGVACHDQISRKNEIKFKGISVSKIALENGNLWMAVLGKGIQSFNINSGKHTQYTYNNSDESMAVNVIVDRDNHVWTIDYTGLKFVDGFGNLLGYYPRPEDPYSIKSNLKGLFHDKQGNFWVYHEAGGLGIRTKQKGFRNFTTTPHDTWYTSELNVTAVHEDASGRLWTGYYNGGLNIFDWPAGKMRTYRNDENNKTSLGRGSVLCIFRDSKGIMWVGTYFAGLQYYDENTDRFINFSHDPDNPNTPAGNDVRSIAEDKEGNLWIAVHGKGVDKIDKERKTITHYNKALNNLSNDWTNEVIIDHNGNVWVATAWGLNVLKKGSDIFNYYISDPADSSAITGDFIITIHEDISGNIWIGTSTGLNRFVDSINRFVHFTNLFESDYITGIISDHHNNLWISTVSGLSRLTSDGKVNNFNTSDGLLSPEFNGRALYRNKKNELFLGGINGVDLFNPDELVFNNTPPPVIISRLMVYNRNISNFRPGITSSNKVKLHFNDKVFTVSFLALNFINPQANSYAYKLEGFEKDWNYVGNVPDATYTNLDPGKYTFRVIAANNDGVWNTTGASLQIIIMPPWYRTLFFQVFSIAVIIVSIFGFIRIRTLSLHRKRILLEKAIREKTNKLKEQSASLMEANKELQKYNKTKDKIFSLVSHDLINPFNTIIGFSGLLNNDYDNIQDEERRNYVRIIHESSEKVFTLLNNLLIWSRSQTNRITCNPERIRVKPVIAEIIELNAEVLKSKNITVGIQVSENMEFHADPEMFKIILRNLFGNAMKFTPKNGTIYVRAGRENGEVKISVTDTGVGMDKEKIDELLSDNLISSEKGTEGETGSGFGLTICKDFIKKHNGELLITSESGKGSTFTFSVFDRELSPEGN